MIRLKRLSDKPVLKPDTRHVWEQKAVFNTAVVYKEDLIHLLYRASDNEFSLGGEKPDPARKFVSSIGYAVSPDGVHFNRMAEPVFKAETPREEWGTEDPRVSKLGEKYYMLYTAFGGRSWDDYRICMAVSTNLIEWNRKGIVLNERNKDAALFPEKIDNRYILLHRREPDIWLAFSRDLKNWTDHQAVMKPRPDSWEEKKIGAAGVPIKLKQGWLLIYHGVDRRNVYRLGMVLLDLKDPRQVIYRQQEPILEPELDWEKHGLVPNVVFSCGAVEFRDDIYVYYGGADTVIGVAALKKIELQRELEIN